MTEREALAFIEKHGVVTESARASVPSLAEQVAGGPIKGSWWGHPKGSEIFSLTRAVRSCPEVLVCRLIDGKVTYVHRRLWPHLVRVADRLHASRISAIREIHTPSGKHVVTERPFPDWVPHDVRTRGRTVSKQDAWSALGVTPGELTLQDKR